MYRSPPAHPPRVEAKEKQQKRKHGDVRLPQRTVPFLGDRSQLVLLNKINTYLAMCKREMRVSLNGYCHGLALLWVYKMTERNAKWFYDMVDNIAATPDDKLLEIETDIEKFIAHIEWCQQSDKYASQGIKVPCSDDTPEDEFKFTAISQRDVGELLGLKKLPSADNSLTQAGWIVLLNKRVKTGQQIAIIRSCTDKKHTVAIFPDDNGYFIYDANFTTGRPKQVDSIIRLVTELSGCFFTTFGMSIPISQIELECDFVEKPASTPAVKKPPKVVRFTAGKKDEVSPFERDHHAHLDKIAVASPLMMTAKVDKQAPPSVSRNQYQGGYQGLIVKALGMFRAPGFFKTPMALAAHSDAVEFDVDVDKMELGLIRPKTGK